jgi:iron complex outermembrane receptor protein
MVGMDQAAFNAGSRRRDDLLIDLMAGLKWELSSRSRIELALGLKNRAPSLIERYLWTPSGANAGLADGRTYLGDSELDPEQAFHVAMAFRHEAERWQFSATPFYQRIHDYIEGRPISRFDGAGNAVLQFTNLDRVELYGLEMDFRSKVHEHLTLRGQMSYVRGRDLESGNPLYRIAPLSGMVGLDYERGNWGCVLESEWAAAQNRVSGFQNEPTTPGFGVVHLRLARKFDFGLRLEAGVENLFDKAYAAHTSGINRVNGSDLAVGRRIPGAGRFFYAGFDWSL